MKAFPIESPFQSTTDHYGALEVAPSATQNEIREAYFRLKMTYQKGSAALYTLIDEGEREDMLRKIEEAYETLSHPERRRNYDRFQCSETHTESVPASAQVISIDRVPPMDVALDTESLLIPPATDFTGPTVQAPPSPSFAFEPFAKPTPAPMQAPLAPAVPAAANAMASEFQQTQTFETPAPAAQPSSSAAASFGPSPELMNEVRDQKEWTGQFLRKVREAYGYSVGDLSSTTKIGKTYIVAIEEESFAKLPAAVFVRGFVSQIARELKLPGQAVASSYMTRYSKVKIG